MACPYFEPTGTLEDHDRWSVAPRLPLGAAGDGLCHAGAQSSRPDEDTLRSYCNRGYARLGCPHYRGDAADALRYSIEFDRDGILGIIFVEERNYGPAAFGRVEYRQDTGEVSGEMTDPILRAQVRAYAASYLRGRGSR